MTSILEAIGDTPLVRLRRYIIPAHRDNLGREVWEQTGGRVTSFVQGIGTATSLLGISDALKPHGVRPYADL